MPNTPAAPVQVLVKGDGSNALGSHDSTLYHSGTALCIFKMQRSRLNTYNATRNCARHMSTPDGSHLKL